MSNPSNAITQINKYSVNTPETKKPLPATDFFTIRKAVEMIRKTKLNICHYTNTNIIFM